MSDPIKLRVHEEILPKMIEGLSPEVELVENAQGVVMNVITKSGTKSALIPKGQDYWLTEADRVEIEREAFNTFEEAAEAEVLKSEGWAEGTQDGTPVEEGSPYYEHSSKYWAEQAEDSAEDAADAALEAQTAAASASAAYGTDLLAPNFSTSSTYAVGDYVIYDGDLYRCTTAVTTAGAWNNSNWTAVDVGGEVGALKSAINTLICNEGSGLNDPDGYFGNPFECFLNTSNKWALVNGSGSHYLIPIKSGDVISITANNTNNAAFAVLKGYRKAAVNQYPDYSAETGFTARITITKGTTEQFTAPTDSAFLCVVHGYESYDMKPVSVVVNGIELITGIRQNIADQKEKEEKDIADASVRREQLACYEYPFPVTRNATWNVSDSRFWNATTRISTEIIPVAKGMLLQIYKGSFQSNLVIYSGEVSPENVAHNDNDWISTAYRYIPIQADGYAVCMFRKNASNPTITYSEFDGSILLMNRVSGLHLTPEQYAIDRAIAVSDSAIYTVGDCACLEYDEARGIAYMLYNTSKTSYGESHDIVALSYFPVDQPWRAVYKEICKVGTVFGNETITEAREENLLFINSQQIRIFLLVSTNQMGLSYRYIDYNPTTDTLGELGLCQIVLNGVSKNVNAYEMRNYVIGEGGVFNSVVAVLPTKLNVYNGVLYATICPGEKGSLTGNSGGNTVFVTSEDYGATFIVKSIVPVIGIYESAVAMDGNGIIYMLCRPTPENADTDAAKKIWISEDDGVTFTAYDYYQTSTTRPAMITYKGKVLTFSSEYDGITRIPNRAGTNTLMTDRNRNNLFIRLGSGTSKSEFKTKFAFKSQHEITYYSPISVEDTVYIAYLTNDIYGKSRGSKNIIKFTRIGEFYTDEQPTDWTL